MPYSFSTVQSLSRGIQSYAFFRSTKLAKASFAYFQDFSKICLRMKIWSMVLRPGRKPHWPSSNFDSTIFRHFLSRHLAYTFHGRLKSDISLSLFTITFLLYRNEHTCLPISWCFCKFSCHLTHPHQPTYSSVQCLQHFRLDFVFTSSLCRFQSSYGCYNFCQCEGFILPKINCIACVGGCCPYCVQQIFKVFSPT